MRALGPPASLFLTSDPIPAGGTVQSHVLGLSAEARVAVAVPNGRDRPSVGVGDAGEDSPSGRVSTPPPATTVVLARGLVEGVYR